MALALGAAAVTVVIIIGVLAGPSVVTCFSASESMGLCLQGKMRDAGLLPAASTTAVEAASEAPAPGTESDAATAATATSSEQIAPELDVTPVDAAAKAAEAAPENLIAATFGLLRAEPDGSVVIAGSGTPGSQIEVYSNGALLGKTTVESSGDWVLVPEIRIAPGGTEITLGETGKEGLAPQSFVVAINEDKTTEPLVVASTPGAVSEVLQGLPQPDSAAAPQIAVAEATTPPPAKPAAAAQPKTPAAAATAPAATGPAASDVAAAPAVDSPAVPAAQPTAEPAPAATTAATAPAPAATPAAAPDATPAQPAADMAAPAATPTAPAATPTEPMVAAAPAAPAASAPAASAPATAAMPATTAAPTIDAVEVDGDRTFFAGSGANGATIRLYVDDAFIADTTVADGRWLIEAGKVLTRSDQRVRVDMLQPGSAEVISRAEVDFHIELPELTEPATPPTAMAQADSQPAPAKAPAADDSAAPAIPSMVAVTIGNLDDQRFAAGKAIIRRGDNLWTIARRVYGEGVKYTTIYQANTSQIRDPDRIYPGQVFNLPESTGN